MQGTHYLSMGQEIPESGFNFQVLRFRGQSLKLPDGETQLRGRRMSEIYRSEFPELGFYGLPGHSRTPRDILKQVQDAEALGVGNVMISERPDYKEISAICGACAAVTESIYIGTSATNLNSRQPVITASIGSTLNRLSNGRFALGLAKGSIHRARAWNIPYPTYAREAEFIDLLRKLWRGESISNYDGELGQYAALALAPYVHEDIPILYVGFGPKSLENAGRIYDGVHLHTFMGDKALTDAVQSVRDGEKAAGLPVRLHDLARDLEELDLDAGFLLEAVRLQREVHLEFPGETGDFLCPGVFGSLGDGRELAAGEDAVDAVHVAVGGSLAAMEQGRGGIRERFGLVELEDHAAVLFVGTS